MKCNSCISTSVITVYHGDLICIHRHSYINTFKKVSDHSNKCEHKKKWILPAHCSRTTKSFKWCPLHYFAQLDGSQSGMQFYSNSFVYFLDWHSYIKVTLVVLTFINALAMSNIVVQHLFIFVIFVNANTDQINSMCINSTRYTLHGLYIQPMWQYTVGNLWLRSNMTQECLLY